MFLREILRRRFLPVLTGLAALFLSVSEASAQPYPEAVRLNDALVKASQSYADGDYNAVISLLSPLSEQFPAEGAVWYYLGMSRLYRRDYEAGTKDLGKAVECEPGNYWYRYYYNLARVYYREDPAEGIAGYEQLLKDYPAGRISITSWRTSTSAAAGRMTGWPFWTRSSSCRVPTRS